MEKHEKSVNLGGMSIVIKFLADILYYKGIITQFEIEDIYEAKTLSDLDSIISKIEGDK